MTRHKNKTGHVRCRPVPLNSARFGRLEARLNSTRTPELTSSTSTPKSQTHSWMAADRKMETTRRHLSAKDTTSVHLALAAAPAARMDTARQFSVCPASRTPGHHCPILAAELLLAIRTSVLAFLREVSGSPRQD